MVIILTYFMTIYMILTISHLLAAGNEFSEQSTGIPIQASRQQRDFQRGFISG